MKKTLTLSGRTLSEPVIQNLPMGTPEGQKIKDALRKSQQSVVVKDFSSLEEALRKRGQ